MPLHVLIIDDHKDYRRLLAHHVTAEWPEARIRGFDPGSDNFDTLNGELQDNDIVLLGQTAVEHDGLKALARIKENPGCPPIVFLAGDENRDVVAARVLQLGADDFIPKSALNNTFLTNAIKQAIKSFRQDRDLFEGFPWYSKRPTGSRIRLEGYQIVQHINAGAVSDVYVAERLPSGMRVALKVFRPRDTLDKIADELKELDQESNLIAKINHPNVVRIFDHGTSEYGAFIAMEYLAGGDLKTRIKQGLSPASALDYLRQLGRSLRAIHASGVMHRDLKPGNTMFRDATTLVLIDFGLAQHLHNVNREANSGGRVLGTPYYMSPEQARGDVVDVRSDLYSLGVMYYEMLTGFRPYTAASPKMVMYKHSYSPVPQLPARLAEYQNIIDMLLAKNPTDRVESADILLDLIRHRH
ncbi:MAG: protein kinase [Gammaproteobacteria bacterium]|nr:protein kinase [Gammaproteobacteria bacterium]